MLADHHITDSLTQCILSALLPHIMERKSGHIVVISSVQGKLGLPLRTSCMSIDNVFLLVCVTHYAHLQTLPPSMLYRATLIH